MDIAGLSISLHNANLGQQVNIALLKKSMDSSQMLSESLLKIMEQSVSPEKGQTIDIRL